MSSVVPSHVLPVLERAVSIFAEKFGRPPAYAAQAPGRVNLIGEHTDYNHGFVFPMAIERCCVVVAGSAHDIESSSLFADAVQETCAANLSGHLIPEVLGTGRQGEVEVKRGTWPSHVLGVAAQFQALGVKLKNIDAVITSDVPLGGGLASSASLEVAFGTLLSLISGHHVQPAVMAKMCQAASHEFVGVPCGIMDQFASAGGEEGRALLIDCQDNTYKTVAMPPADTGVIVIADTGVKHTHAGGEYTQRATACAQAAKVLGVTSLRQVSFDGLQAALKKVGSDLAPLVDHVVSENHRVGQFIAAFAKGELAAAGRCMYESHESLRSLYRVSCPELDQMVGIAQKTPGVFGARMTGGGFGGCIVALATPESAHDLIENLKKQYTSPSGATPVAFATRAASGAGSIDLA